MNSGGIFDTFANRFWPAASKRLLSGGILLLTALVVYSGGFGNGFLVNWDDPDYVTANPDIQSLSLASLLKIFTSFYVGNYAPVQMLSYMLDHALWGARPLAFLLVNVALHGLNAYLFYRLLRRLRLAEGWALFAALLFIVHPVQVESVAWISQRKNVLAMSFFLAAFQAYLVYAEAEARRWRPYLLALLWFTLALLSKSVTVILPAVLLAYDFTLRPERGGLRALAAEKLPFVLLAGGGSWLAILSQQSQELMGLAVGYHGGSGWATFLTMLTVYKDYLFNLCWPLQLSAIYQVDIKSAVDGEVVYSLALLALSLALPLLVRRDVRRDLVFWLAVFFIGFLPVAQIVPIVTLMNDRYLYFPLLGFAGASALLLKEGLERFPRLLRPAQVAGLVLLVGLALAAWQRTGVWSSSLTLWQDAVHKQPQTSQAWRNLGNAHDHSGNNREAIVAYRQALSLKTTDYETWYNLGTNYLMTEQLPAAADAYRRALELAPDYRECLQNLALVETLLGRHALAIATLARAIEADRGHQGMLLLLGGNHYCLGDFAAARAVYERVRHGDRRSGLPAVATGLLALVASRQGDAIDSGRLWQEARRLGLAEAELNYEWARLEAMANRRDQAIEFIGRALATGFRDRAALLGDPAFAGLRGDPRFAGLARP